MNGLNAPKTLRRLSRFVAVGAGGVIVQAVTLALLLRASGIHYLAATAVAVEAAALHNFVWHRRWTWAERPRSCWPRVLLRFNLTNGVASIAGNLIVVFVFVRLLNLNPLAANLLAIGICSIITYTISDRVVFV